MRVLFLSLPNVIVTPHVSAHTKEAFNIKMGRIAALNVIRVLQGEELYIEWYEGEIGAILSLPK